MPLLSDEIESCLLQDPEDFATRCSVLELGVQDYEASLAIQNELVERRKRNEISDCLLFVEYPHIITLGRSGKIDHLLASESEMKKSGVKFTLTNRGGDITYHGPGQLIAYPVLDLKHRSRDIDHYLRDLELCIMETLTDFGILPRRVPGATGVWVGEEKIAAMGIRTSQWVTSHGVALNVSTDLNYFNFIIPCGLKSKSVTSMAQLLGAEVDMSLVKERFCFHFGKVFERSLHPQFLRKEFQVNGLKQENSARHALLHEVDSRDRNPN